MSKDFVLETVDITKRKLSDVGEKINKGSETTYDEAKHLANKGKEKLMGGVENVKEGAEKAKDSVKEHSSNAAKSTETFWGTVTGAS